MARRKTFKATIKKQAMNPYVDVPASVSRAFADQARAGRINVEGLLNRTEIRGTLIPVGRGGHRFFLHGGMRSAAEVGVGDQVRLTLSPVRPGALMLPRDLAAAFKKASTARKKFDSLSDAHQRQLLRFIDSATPRQRDRRIAETIDHLSGRKARQAKLSPERPLWTCPKCGHEFVNANQYHSCNRLTIEDTFAGKPADIRRLFDRFRAMVESLGPVKTVAYRDNVAFMVRVRFARAMPRSRWLDVAFWLRRRMDNPRFQKVETLLPNAHVYLVRMTSPDEIDRQLKSWISEAYEIGCQRPV